MGFNIFIPPLSEFFFFENFDHVSSFRTILHNMDLLGFFDVARPWDFVSRIYERLCKRRQDSGNLTEADTSTRGIFQYNSVHTVC